MLSGQFSEGQTHVNWLTRDQVQARGQVTSSRLLQSYPRLNSLAAGDIELWFNIRIPWDPNDPLTVLTAEHATITGTGPHYIVVNICAPWIKIDVVVAHAPRSWNPKKHNKTQPNGIEVEEAETQSAKFSEHLTGTFAKRPLPHCRSSY